MDPEPALTEGRIDHLDDGVGHSRSIRIRRHYRGQDPLAEASTWTGLVFRGDPPICRLAGMGEVVGARGEHPAQ
jgi:hypothetical protein